LIGRGSVRIERGLGAAVGEIVIFGTQGQNDAKHSEKYGRGESLGFWHREFSIDKDYY